MKVLFLDIDGVLCLSSNGIDLDKAEIVKLICQETGAKIVISSTWRLDPWFLEDIEKTFAKINFDNQIIDKTPDIDVNNREIEIREWLKKNKVEKFAVLDDDVFDKTESQYNVIHNNSMKNFGDSFFQTTWKDGLTIKIGQKIINHLGKI